MRQEGEEAMGIIEIIRKGMSEPLRDLDPYKVHGPDEVFQGVGRNT